MDWRTGKLVVFILLLVTIPVQCRRRGRHGGRYGSMWGWPRGRLTQLWVDWFFKQRMSLDDNGRPLITTPTTLPSTTPETAEGIVGERETGFFTPASSDPLEPVANPNLNIPVIPGQVAVSEICSYPDGKGGTVTCEQGCCLTSLGVGCCTAHEVKDDKAEDNTRLIIYIALGTLGGIAVALITAFIIWRACKSTTPPGQMKPVKSTSRRVSVSSIIPVKPAVNHPQPRRPPHHTRQTFQPQDSNQTRQSRDPRQSREPSSQRGQQTQLRHSGEPRQQSQPIGEQRQTIQPSQPIPSHPERPPSYRSSRYDIFAVTAVLPSYSDVTPNAIGNNRPPPEYSVDEQDFGSGYLRNISSPPPPYTPTGHRGYRQTSGPQNVRFSRLGYSNV